MSNSPGAPATRLWRSEAGLDALRLMEACAVSPGLAEDCRSLLESQPYLVRFREGTPPIRCECCGALVIAVPEADTRTERPYRWECAIWEQAGRKHTLRRCKAMAPAKAQGAPAIP